MAGCSDGKTEITYTMLCLHIDVALDRLMQYGREHRDNRRGASKSRSDDHQTWSVIQLDSDKYQRQSDRI